MIIVFFFTFVELFVCRGIGTGFARMKNNNKLCLILKSYNIRKNERVAKDHNTIF